MHGEVALESDRSAAGSRVHKLTSKALFGAFDPTDMTKKCVLRATPALTASSFLNNRCVFTMVADRFMILIYPDAHRLIWRVVVLRHWGILIVGQTTLCLVLSVVMMIWWSSSGAQENPYGKTASHSTCARFVGVSGLHLRGLLDACLSQSKLASCRVSPQYSS